MRSALTCATRAWSAGANRAVRMNGDQRRVEKTPVVVTAMLVLKYSEGSFPASA
jgi:hypothetical protein